jgi:2,4-diketo-3-deoxy-L-fuconate hydrolase
VEDELRLHSLQRLVLLLQRARLTSQFIFGVPQVLAYISQFMRLEPGDIVLTGTPAGVGLGRKPQPVFLKPGDVVRLGAGGLGEQCQTCVQV